jgi:hypothetical protein
MKIRFKILESIKFFIVFSFNGIISGKNVSDRAYKTYLENNILISINVRNMSFSHDIH